MDTNIQKVTNDLLSDAELMSKIERAETSNEVSELLAEKGVDINAETIDAFMRERSELGELSENELENVAGGKFKLRYLNPVYWIGRLLAYAVTKDMC